LGARLPYDSQPALRARLAEVAPHFAIINNVQQPVWLNGEVMKGLEAIAEKQVRRSGCMGCA
jgi:NADH dehydrogenase (ubiquinone) Fe-S protein 1